MEIAENFQTDEPATSNNYVAFMTWVQRKFKVFSSKRIQTNNIPSLF